MVKSDERKLAMIMAISEVLRIKKGRKEVSHEEIIRELERFIHRTKDKNSRLMMIVAASKTIDILNKNPKMSDKEVMREAVKEFDSMIQKSESVD